MSICIANSKGVVGTLACFARTVHQNRAVFLTNCHVLFGAGAVRSDPVWQVLGAASDRRYLRLGSALRGVRGTVRYRGNEYFVDCAIGVRELPWVLDCPELPTSPLAPRRGEHVRKTGGATGTTAGAIVDASYSCSMPAGVSASNGLHEPAQRQFLIRGSGTGQQFSQQGDSGALVFNGDQAVIGLLWGVTVAADSVACPIGPVLHALNIRLCEAQA